jgi:hypothetical protein
MRGRVWRPGRQTPKVRDGRVQKKHRWDYYFKEHKLREGDGEIPIVREPAVRGARHLITEPELRSFVGIIPDWDRCSEGLRCLVLGAGDDDCYGWHDVGVICVHAWSSTLEETWPRSFYDEHRDVLERLMVPVEDAGEEREDCVRCRFSRRTAFGFLLMHVFLHELGHHYDCRLTKKKQHAGRGEPYAESFGILVSDAMWERFFRVFEF